MSNHIPNPNTPLTKYFLKVDFNLKLEDYLTDHLAGLKSRIEKKCLKLFIYSTLTFLSLSGVLYFLDLYLPAPQPNLGLDFLALMCLYSACIYLIIEPEGKLNFEKVPTNLTEDILKRLKEFNLTNETALICQDVKKHGSMNTLLYKEIEKRVELAYRENIIKTYCPTGQCS